MPLKESFRIFEEAESIINETPGELGVELRVKLSLVLKRNPDFKSILKANTILNFSTENIYGIEKIANEHIIKYKYAPLTSCDVERSFSAYKMIYSEKRTNLTVENLERMIVIYCNMNYRS